MQDHRSYKPCSAFSRIADSGGHAVNRCPDAVSESQSQMSLTFPQSVQIALPESNRNHFDGTFHENLQSIDIHEQPLCSDAVTKREVTCKVGGNAVESAPLSIPAATVRTAPASFKALPPSLDWLLNPDKGRSLSDRVMARLIQSEAHETDVWLRQDYRQAQICLSLAMRGNTEPFLVSSYTVYGVHPDKVWEKIMHNRHMRLAKEFPDWWDADGNRKPDIPKKPTTSVAVVAAAIPPREGADAIQRVKDHGYTSGETAPVSSADKFVNERLAALVPPKKETA